VSVVSNDTPSALYHVKQREDRFEHDARQASLVIELDLLAEQLVQENHQRQSFFSKFIVKTSAVQGLYLWGSVGVGKTMLMDCFYESLPFSKKQRWHFHAFMQALHEQLNHFSGKKDPLKYVANQIAKKTMVLCFDEFFVKDIADAMLLGGVLTHLFDEGVCLVATSNIPPHQLYEDGLQRQNFLATIKLIEEKTRAIHLDTENDYRKEFFSLAGVYYMPLDFQAEEKMAQAFRLYSKGVVTKASIELYGRNISVIQRSDNAIWCEFTDLCGIPRSQNDYLALVKQYEFVFVSHLTVITESENDLITSLINLVDIFYDAGVKLILSSDVLPRAIYPKGRMSFAFERTQSRLQEMQSEEYVHRAPPT
jgi:cell division protein ZapE